VNASKEPVPNDYNACVDNTPPLQSKAKQNQAAPKTCPVIAGIRLIQEKLNLQESLGCS
jgi:hypothetical protein